MAGAALEFKRIFLHEQNFSTSARAGRWRLFCRIF